MLKGEFLDRLAAGLAGLPQDDITAQLAFYDEMIDDRMEEGLTEEAAVAEMGAVEDIVRQTLEETPLTSIVKERVSSRRRMAAWEIVLLVLGSPLWLSLLIAAAAVLLSVYIVIWAVIVCLWAVTLAFAVCVPAGIFGGMFFIIRGNFPQGLALIGAGVACAGLAILMFFASLAATRGAAKLTKKIALWVKSLFLRKENAK